MRHGSHPTKGPLVKLQVVVSSISLADQAVVALRRLGHDATSSPDLPGLVVVDNLAPVDAPAVQRITAMVDHPARATVA